MENEIPVKTTNQLIQHINEAAVFTDASFVITACNTAAAALFQFNEHDLPGLNICSFLSPSSTTSSQALLSKNKKTFTSGIITSINAGGKKIPVQIIRYAIAPTALDGGYLFIYQPIEQAHVSIESSISLQNEHSFQWPGEPSGKAIILFNKTYHCLDANTNACCLTGYSKQELTTLHWRNLLHYDELDQSMPGAKPGEKIIVEKQMRRKDGSAWYGECMLQSLCDDRIICLLRDVTDRKKTELALLQSEEEFRKTTDQLRELSDHLLNIRETERKNIAREIHDELGQQLTILKMDVSWIHQKLQKYEDTALLQKTGSTLQLLNETIKTVRRIATELRPSMLDDLGIIEAIEWQSKEFEKRTGISVSFESGIAHLTVTNSVATSLFRIYQEALTNVARHANAKNVFSSMQLENDQVTLTIKDDGIGFDMQQPGDKKTLGLLGMKERTLMMGGRFEINSKAGEGTTILVTTSIHADESARSQTD
jgi:PAS domain S-box-containing protein